MLLWASLLFLAPVSGQLATAPKPTISLHPPWTTVFKGETVNLTCDGFHFYAPEKIKWYRHFLGRETQIETLGNTFQVHSSGDYRCQAEGSQLSNPVRLHFSSDPLILQAPDAVFEELFPRPKLTVTASQPTEGNSVNLSCETQLPLERSDTQLHFVFFRDNEVILSDWSRSPEFQITTIWREDSGSYWCGAETMTHSVHKRSLPLQIQVQRIPVSGVLLETQPQEGHVVEGETLILVCSVAEGTGDTTFSWHREDTKESLGRKSQRSQKAELRIPVTRESHAGEYYCTADNGYGHIRSEVVNITVRSPPGNRSGLIAGGATGVSLSILLAAALLFCCWHQRKSETPLSQSLNLPSHASEALLSTGDGFLKNRIRSPPTPGLRESAHPTCPAAVELQQLYSNVHRKEGDLVYSEIQIIQQGEEKETNTSRTSLEDKCASVIYSEVKRQLSGDSAGMVHCKDEEAMESYENVPHKTCP
ncbi:Fc receptor-like protein 4 isoform X3 [Equus asinus]|uniref:Fc receptor-like protein 4 isoform X3 n=1 Tax=Equus asinus TaxID=9793 RepID=UPI00071A5CC5